MNRLDEIKGRLNKGLADKSLSLRINTWLTAGDGRELLTTLLDDCQYLIIQLEACSKLEARCQRMKEALEGIENLKTQTILGPSALDDGSETFEGCHEIGAHKAFQNCADIARSALAEVEK